MAPIAEASPARRTEPPPAAVARRPPPPSATSTASRGTGEDAERVFRDVLTQEPGNLRARQGLAELAEDNDKEPAALVALPRSTTQAQQTPRTTRTPIASAGSGSCATIWPASSAAGRRLAR